MIQELAPRIVPIVLSNITSPYPYHDSHLTLAGESPHDPLEAHPAFGNSFDWHSSVHSHWTAIALIDYFAAADGDKPREIAQLEDALAENLRAENLRVEQTYLAQRSAYERPYGWAWAMALAARANASPHPVVRASLSELHRLARSIAEGAVKWLEILPMPVRHGVHSNTAFALGLMLDASRSLGYHELERTIVARSRAWFKDDRDWPARFERSGSDFLSPGLTEADLMRRLLPAREFTAWWNSFLPSAGASPLVEVVRIPEVDDGHVVHLHGLNLSRASALARVAALLGERALLERARNLYAASIGRVTSGYYSETHWLPTYAWDAALAIDDALTTLS